MLLQSLTGLTDADPIHRYLGMVDRFLGSDHDWSETNQSLTKDDLIQGVWYCLGHPAQYPTVEDYCLDNFEKWLKDKNEPIIADIVFKLRRRVGVGKTKQESFDNYGVRLVIMWLVANVDYLKEKYLEETKRQHRRITSSWKPSQE